MIGCCVALSSTHPKSIEFPVKENIQMNIVNMCEIIKGIIKINETNKLNSVKILGPFQRHINKDGNIANWGVYLLQKNTLGFPARLMLIFDQQNINQIILSPTSKSYFSSSLFLNKECVDSENMFFIKADVVNDINYKFINKFIVENSKNTMEFKFFSNEKYTNNGIIFNRLVIDFIDKL